MIFHPGRATAAALLSVCALPAFAAGPGPAPGRDGFWPEGRRPPFTAIDPSLASDPAAVLLRNGSFVAVRRGPDPAAALPAALRGAPVEDGGWLIVVFDAALDPSARLDLLERHGALAGPPLPNHARLARVPRSAVTDLATAPGVIFTGRLHPGFKLSPNLGLRPEGTRTPPDGAWLVDVLLLPGADPDAVGADLAVLGALPVEREPGRLRVAITDGRAAMEAARLDEVLFVDEATVPELLNDRSRWVCQTGVTGSSKVHDKGIRGAGQTVAVMDSGVDTAHCCFSAAGKIVDNRAWGGGQLGPDCNGDHGTHTSGTAVCGAGSSYDGLAPDARLVMQDIGKKNDCTRVYPPTLSDAWNDAYGRGVRVHSNSWGGGFNGYSFGSQSIDSFAWQKQDFVIVYAAGNNGPASGTLGEYSNAKNSITVGGTQNGAQSESMYFWSSRGPAGDGRTMPDLTAPAEVVNSASSGTGCSWVGFGGTSMSTPAVAGSAALVREYFLRGFYPSGAAVAPDGFSPSAALVKGTMLLSTRNMTNAGSPRPSNVQGYGRLTLDDALWFAGDAATERLQVLDDRNATTGFTAAGQTHTFALTLTQSGPLKVVLAWTDAPGVVLAAKALVNDLDLEVVTAGGTYTGNQGINNGWTTATSSAYDRLNNKEAVFLQSVAAGNVTIRVKSFAIGDVAAHPQDYALIAVGPAIPPCTQAVPPGVGNSVTQRRQSSDVKATWADRGADHYVVYRGTTPNFYTPGMTPYRASVTDEDAGTAGIQWTDTGAAGGTTSYYYLYASANACGDIVP